MSTRNIILGIAALVIIVGGGYYFMNGNTSSSANTQGNGTTTPQVQAQDITVGTGAEAAPGDKVSVLYEGKFEDGTVFDSSAAHGNQPLVFTLGVDQLIPGFQIGVNGMKEGGERRMAIPPELGYGPQDVKDPSGKVIIPAGSLLIFDVKLVKVEKATTTAQ